MIEGFGLLIRKCPFLLRIGNPLSQGFGHFTGKSVLIDGTALKVRNFLGFAEDVYNRW